MNKLEARKKALASRRNACCDIASENAINALKSGILDEYTRIGIYYPIGKELNITKLKDMYPDKSFYLPVTKEDIYFVSYTSDNDLIDGPFNTKEPNGDMVERDSIECFIIPCVGISIDNKRIGYGKGYYDRYLEGYTGFKIGVCYKDASNLDVAMDSYDVILDKVILG